MNDSIVAWAPSGAYASGDGWFWMGVESSHRRRGLGGRLYERIEATLRALGVVRIETAPNDEDGRRFLVVRGYAVDAVDQEPRARPADRNSRSAS